MISRADFVATVKGYVGTPYGHLGRLPGVSLDCVGLILCALKDCGEPVEGHIAYGVTPTLSELEGWLATYAMRKTLDDAEPGDILATVYRGHMGHATVYVGDDRVVQARARRAGGRVCYTPVGKALRVASCWALRRVA